MVVEEWLEETEGSVKEPAVAAMLDGAPFSCGTCQVALCDNNTMVTSIREWLWPMRLWHIP